MLFIHALGLPCCGLNSFTVYNSSHPLRFLKNQPFFLFHLLVKLAAIASTSKSLYAKPEALQKPSDEFFLYNDMLMHNFSDPFPATHTHIHLILLLLLACCSPTVALQQCSCHWLCVVWVCSWCCWGRRPCSTPKEHTGWRRGLPTFQ